VELCRLWHFNFESVTVRKKYQFLNNALAAWRSGYRTLLRNKRPGFESRQGISFWQNVGILGLVCIVCVCWKREIKASPPKKRKKEYEIISQTFVAHICKSKLLANRFNGLLACWDFTFENETKKRFFSRNARPLLVSMFDCRDLQNSRRDVEVKLET
jgi:hypothetical protein